MWTKLSKSDVLRAAGFGRGAKSTPRVLRTGSKRDPAALALPKSMATAPRVDILVDGTRVAYVFSDKGEYKVRKAGQSTTTVMVSIPKAYVQSAPLSTSDVTLIEQDGMLILDFAQFRDVLGVAV